MFERFIRLAEAKGALRKGRYEQALELSNDPLVRSHRRAIEIREKALAGLLERAQHRVDRGGLSAALSDVSRILSVQPEYNGAQTLKEDVRKELEDAKSLERTAREMLAKARKLAEDGELQAAGELCGAAAELQSLPADEQSVRQLIEGRQRAAADLLARAGDAHRRGELAEARSLLQEARTRCRNLPGTAKLGLKLAAARARELLERLRGLHKAGDDAAAYALLSKERALLPELADMAELQKFSGETAAFCTAQLTDLLDRRDLDQAVEIYRDLDPRLVHEPALSELRVAMDEICRALDLRDRGDFGGAGESLGRAHRTLRSKGIKATISELERAKVESEAALVEARELSAAGRLVEARQRLTPILERWPMHEAVRREMQILDQGARDREQRLANARAVAEEGRLCEASSLALSLAVAGSQGEEARLLLKEVQARMDLVRAGLDQVRRAVHGRHSGSVEGLGHCLLRLEQLGKVQTDSEDIARLKAAIQAEIEGVRVLDSARVSLEQSQPAEVAEHLTSIPQLFGQLLRPDRLDARALELADLIAAKAEEAVAGGRLTAARGWLCALDPLASRYADVKERMAALGGEEGDRRKRAKDAADRGEQALAGRDLEDADRWLQEARSAWVDGAPVARLEAQLRGVHGQNNALDEVEELTAKQDYDAAHRKLGHMPPTPAVLRTRIFDIKQSLARAQGLDCGFLLRVDEGGEYLVLRGDSISIGNVRDGQADLAVLASIAGRHATISRSMSFHGGMQDRIRAERGEVRVGGSAVGEHKLRDGDRVRLGAALELVYGVPSSRSLTASLTLSSGFQVSGTDKILLMRDRGRDGRILIGATLDAHVRVPHDQPEIEIFARKDGQMRVSFAGKGLLNGRPFTGEHPVAAGALVRCGEVSFVLQPWTKPF